MTPLTTYYVSSNIGASFRCGMNSVVIDHGTAMYLAAEVDAALRKATLAGMEVVANKACNWDDHDMTPGACCANKIGQWGLKQAEALRKAQP